VSEMGTVGFNLLRQDPASGEFVQINDHLLPGLLTAPQGGVYRYPDRAVTPGETYTYRLQEIEARGAIRSYGPFTVTAGVGKQLARTEQAQSLAAAEATPRADGYERAAHVPTGRTIPSRAMRRLEATTQAKTPKAAVRIRIEREGLYVVDANQIATALDVDPRQIQTWIAQGKLRLQNKGQSVAWMADPSGNQLYFYGQPLQGTDSAYTRFNVYWLDQANGLTMNVLKGKAPIPTTSMQPFQSSIHVEENRYAFPYLITDPDADFWYWDYVVAGGYTPTFAVPTPGAVAGTATLRAYLQGGTDLVTGHHHHAHVLVNGVEVGDAVWEGITPYVLTTTFDASLLVDGNNTVTVSGALDPNISLSTFAVNGFDLDYPRAYQAVDNQLRLRGAGNFVVTVDGFSGSNIAVLNISDPRKPQWLAATTIPLAGGMVSFIPATRADDYIAAIAATPVSVDGTAAPTLKTQNSGTNYLVLAPSSLRTGADTLATHRGGKVVELQDIYDTFNNGIVNPNAIRDFLSYAYRSWQPKPRYVVLVGKGTIDPKDYQHLGTNLFPVLMTVTPDGLFATDSRYADLDNNGVPELAIGRIPALTADDVTQYVAKLQTYESGRSSATALLVADNPDSAGDFAANSDAVARSLRAKKVATKLIYYQSGTPADTTRQRIIDDVNAGVGIINYVGHAAVTQLAHEGLLRISDVSQLTNSSQLPLFLGLTCYMGNGSFPGFDSLAETLLWQQDGGIVAALAPVGMSDNDQAHILNLSIVDALFSGGANSTLGDATNAALTNLARKGGQRYMLDIYQVFGDPALHIHP
ncbi:MAG: C25 family cysteine peptidase, partial [Candidatus Competibacter sp.]|nr:C25 family cysteine peptidase [Candidatus Competibacter sp.]